MKTNRYLPLSVLTLILCALLPVTGFAESMPPETGEGLWMSLWIVLAAVSGAGLLLVGLIFLIVKRREKNKFRDWDPKP